MCTRHEIARFERAGDVRTIGSLELEDGALEVREDLSGPSVLIAYGDNRHGLRMRFERGERARLQRTLGEAGHASVSEYLSEEETSLVDLMDLCDVGGIAYSFVGLGDRTGIQFRPS